MFNITNPTGSKRYIIDYTHPGYSGQLRTLAASKEQALEIFAKQNPGCTAVRVVEAPMFGF